MKTFTAIDGTEIFYKDIGEGTPVILIHGWPLSSDMWEEQIPSLLDAGFRVIAYDRRGFGKSDQPAGGYNFETFASDLNDLITHLEIKKVSLVGFSMGGGEIARYLGRFGSDRVSCVSLISSITPLLKYSQDNPYGIPEEKIVEIEHGLLKDRFSFLHDFFKDFFGVTFVSRAVSPQVVQWAEQVASQASLKATLDCVNAFARTDFRDDMMSFTLPTLIIHGTADKTVPIATSGDQASRLIPSALYKKYEGAPHGLNMSHKEQLNHDLIEFLRAHAADYLTVKQRNQFQKHFESSAPDLH